MTHLCRLTTPVAAPSTANLAQPVIWDVIADEITGLRVQDRCGKWGIYGGLPFLVFTCFCS